MKLKTTFSAPLLIIVIMLLMVVSRLVDPSALALEENICLSIIVLQIVLVLVPALFYIKIRGASFSSQLSIRPFGLEKLLTSLLAFVTLVLGDTLIRLLLYLIGLPVEEFSVYAVYLGNAQPSVLYALVTFALLPAVIEELVFRSVLMAEYKETGFAVSVIASSALYGMFSLDFGGFFVHFFSGLIFALVMYLTRSVLASMLCHLCYNLFGLLANQTINTIIAKPQSAGFLVFVLASLFLICLATLFGESERICYTYSLTIPPSETPSAKSGVRSFGEALLAPPFFAALVIFVIAALQYA